jgi:type IV fimbrial biogenesis protein FimT
MKRKKTTGFTLIELMMTIVIAGILLAVAVPSYTTMVLNNCLTTKTNGFISAMQLARSSAVTFRAPVTVGALPCSLSGGGACDITDEFGTGIVVFLDVDADGVADTDVEDANGDGVLNPGEDFNGNGRLDIEIIKQVRFNCAATMDEVALGIDAVVNSTALVYSPTGSATPLGTINICDTRTGETGRQVTLSATGRPTTNSTFVCP